MMLDGIYRQRLEADLVRWQSDGVISSAVGEAIRAALPPRPKGINIATAVAIVGGLLLAAAFLAFVAANWTAIVRPARFMLLLAGIASAFALGGAFDRTQRPYLADLGATVGSISFGAAIALVGQMYHLGDDFAGGLLLWALGAFTAALLTGSRGALAVSLAAACVWTGASVHAVADVPHLPFVAFWLACAALAVTWDAPSARHLLGVAAVAWWTITGINVIGADSRDGMFVFAAGSALMFGGGLLIATMSQDRLRSLGRVVSIYGTFGLATVAAATPLIRDSVHPPFQAWVIGCALAGFAFAAAAAVIRREVATGLASVAIGLALVALADVAPVDGPWFTYALALMSMLSLLVSGTIEGARPRIVAGWVGIGCVIAAITWVVEGSMLYRAAFLGAAGLAAIGLASVLGHLARGESRE
jgi:hypothetical protein